MTNEYRTADEIERDIERERAEMTGTFNALQDKFSVNAIAGDLGAMFRGQGGQLGRSISHTVGRNPTAVALVGVGLAWLLISQSRNRAADASTWSPTDRPSSRHPAPAFNPQGNRPPYPAQRSDNLPANDGDRYWFNDYGHAATAPSQRASDRSPDHAQGSDGIRDTLRHGAETVASSVSHAAASVRDGAADLTERLLSGTEGFSDEAKDRILSARRMAHDARIAAQAAMQRGGRAASNLFEDQPLVVGALAVALGAAIGGALPHSRIEDEALGAERDRLFADAQRLFHDERAKAMAVVKTATAEARNVVRDAGADLADMIPDAKTAGDVIVDHVSDAASRVADSAREEADRQGLMGKRPL